MRWGGGILRVEGGDYCACDQLHHSSESCRRCETLLAYGTHFDVLWIIFIMSGGVEKAMGAGIAMSWQALCNFGGFSK